MGLDSTDEVGCSVPVRGLRCFLGTGDLMNCLGDANGETLALFFLFRVHLYAISLLLLACSRCELLLASVFTCASQELSPTVLKLALWLCPVSIGRDGLVVESTTCVWSDSSLVPRHSHVFQRFTRKIGKAWSILLCNDDVLDAVWAAVSYLCLLAHAIFYT